MPSSTSQQPPSGKTPDSQNNGSLDEEVITSIPSVPVTVERKPFIQNNEHVTVPHTGTPRANLAVTYEKPKGSVENGWAAKNQDKTVLQQHCLFFDQDGDGVIWPQDTFAGFYKLGFGIIWSFLAMLIINGNFSYPTAPSWIPDPFFRVYTTNIHKGKHGSDSGTYDTEGRFVPQKFEDMFCKYAGGKDSINLGDVWRLLKGQRLAVDPFGWGGAMLEWLTTYLLLWPEDGEMKKEDIRGMYDGSLFFEIAEGRSRHKSKSGRRMVKGELLTAW